MVSGEFEKLLKFETIVLKTIMSVLKKVIN